MEDIVKEMKLRSINLNDLLGIKYLIKKRAEKLCIQQKDKLRRYMQESLEAYQKDNNKIHIEAYHLYEENIKLEKPENYIYESKRYFAKQESKGNWFSYYDILELY